MRIFIPSMKRVNLQYTLESIRDESPYLISLVVPPEEKLEYSKRWGPQMVMSPPESITGISATRQWIMEKAADGEEFVAMMDDDLKFFRRRNDNPEKFDAPENGDIREMLTKLHAILHRYAHASIAMREGANWETEEVKECVRMCRVIAYHRPTFLKTGCDFSQSTVMDDFEATLFLLTRGYKNGVLNSYVQNQRGSGTVGGASVYRTLETQRLAALTLQSRYPQFVKAVQKKTKTKAAWGAQERTDVRISWKVAYEYGQRTSDV